MYFPKLSEDHINHLKELVKVSLNLFLLYIKPRRWWMICSKFLQSTGKIFFRSFIVSRCQELESLRCLETVNQELSGCAMGETPHKHEAF